jgi:response regulator RpfG family c-di-GMP phosphodiesterase
MKNSRLVLKPALYADGSEAALAELKRCSGTQFDPCIVKKVIKVIKEAVRS